MTVTIDDARLDCTEFAGEALSVADAKGKAVRQLLISVVRQHLGLPGIEETEKPAVVDVEAVPKLVNHVFIDPAQFGFPGGSKM